MFAVVPLSLLAAFFFAAAAAIQQRATRQVADQDGPADDPGRLTALLPVIRLVRSLLQSRLWLLGWVTNLLGFLVQAVALHLGSVALVQPLLVAQLIFTLAIVSIWSRRRLLARDWLAALSICAGVAVFLSVRGAAPQDGTAHRGSVLAAGAAVVVLVGVLVVAAQARPPTIHTTCIGSAAGLCFAFSAVLTKLTATDLIHRGIPATAMDWPGYTLAASTLLGLLLEQQAFGVGPLPIAVAAMSVVNPIASYFIGILAFDVHISTGPGALAAVCAAGVLLTLGAVRLAHSPTVLGNAISPATVG